MTEIQSNTRKSRPNGHQNRPGGLLSSGIVENRANPVLKEDIYEEPIQVAGIIKMVGDYVRFFDNTDSLLHTISAVYNTSPTTRAIIRQKVTLTLGDGFNLTSARRDTLFPALAKADQVIDDPAILSAIDEKLSNVNGDGETIVEVAEKVMMEFLTYGNAYVSFSRARGGKEVFCHHLPFVKGRVHQIEEDGVIPNIGFNNDWKVREWTDANVQKIPLYPKWSEADESGVERTVIHLKDHAPGFEYYGLPEWIAALMYAEMEYRIGKFNSSKFDNSFVPSGVLQFFGASSKPEAEGLVRDVKNKFVGTGKNGGLLVQVLRDADMKANFVPIEDKSEGAFLELSRVSAQAIVSAHRWTMSLAGFATGGKLGSNEQIRREFEIAQNTVIAPLQNMLCRRFLNVYMKELGAVDSAFKGVYLSIQNSTPVSFIGDIQIDSVLTRDEKREVIGYGPAPDGAFPDPIQQPIQQQDNGGNNDPNTNPAG